MSQNLKLETEAYRGLADLLEKAEKVRILFEQAGSPLPDALQRLVRSNGHVRSQVPLTSFRPSDAPPNVASDWLWVELKNAAPGTVALAVLKASETLLTTKEIQERMRALPSTSGVSVGTIANVGTRAFENGVIGRTDDGRWQLIKPEKAGVIHNDFIWGELQAFQTHEIASHRRDAIVYLLRQNPVGLQITQIVAELRKQELVQIGVPVNKSLIKTDMEEMNGQRVRRRGNSKKWEAI